MNTTAAVLAEIVITYGLLYVFVLTIGGLGQARRCGARLAWQEELMAAAVERDPDLVGYTVWFLIAALDEESVIGSTISALLRDQPGAAVVVVDDGSDDHTAEIVESFIDTGRVRLCRRALPDARRGKGAALNAGLDMIRDEVAATGLPRSRVVVGVLDADGRLTPNASTVVAREFAADPSVGGVQLVVRIRNRQSFMLEFQDMEFWAMAALGQLGRVSFGSVSMGGNGQFTRLSALDEAGPQPWSTSLTEDLDLGITLAVLGWRATSTPWAYVSQQGVGSFGRLIRQRTRWYQGHMESIRRLPELARSQYLPTGRFLELAAYLGVPWLLSLPWSILQQYILIEVALGHGLPVGGGSAWWGRPARLAFFYLVSFAPNLFWGVAYWWRTGTVRLAKALVMAHLLIPWSYLAYLAAWRALGRMLVGRRSWVKTARETEPGPIRTEPAAT